MCQLQVGAQKRPLPTGSLRSAELFPARGNPLLCGLGAGVVSLRCGAPHIRVPARSGVQPGECLYRPHSAPEAAADVWLGTPSPPWLQKPLCSGSACPNLPLGPLRGPGKKSASLLSMCPSNTVIPPPPPALPLRSNQAVHKWHQHQHRSCGNGSSGCPAVHQLFVSQLVGLALALPLPAAPLSIWDPLPLPFHLQGRVGDGGLPLKFRKRTPLHSPLTAPFLVSEDPGRGRRGIRGQVVPENPSFRARQPGFHWALSRHLFFSLTKL